MEGGLDQLPAFAVRVPVHRRVSLTDEATGLAKDPIPEKQFRGYCLHEKRFEEAAEGAPPSAFAGELDDLCEDEPLIVGPGEPSTGK